MPVQITVEGETLDYDTAMALSLAVETLGRKFGSVRLLTAEDVRFPAFGRVRESWWPWKRDIVEHADRIMSRCPDGQWHDFEGTRCTFCGFRESVTFPEHEER